MCIDIEIAQISASSPGINRVNSNLPVKVQDCQATSTFAEKVYATFYEYIERIFQCTGWCPQTRTLYYKWTNVNNGKSGVMKENQ